MQRTVLTSSPITATAATGIALSQTPGSAGNLTLNGALVTGGVAVISAGEMEQPVTVTTISNESAKTLTIYGTDANGRAISEVMTGPNATTGTAALMYRTVTRIAVSAAFTGAVTVGVTGTGVTKMATPDYMLAQFNIGIGCVIAGTVTYTLQHTFDDINSPTFSAARATWFPNTGLTSKSANTDGNYAFAVTGIRNSIASGTGTVVTTLIQGTY